MIITNKNRIKRPYQHLRELKDVNGFIINVKDAINFDIDLEIPPEFKQLYENVIIQEYTYKNLDSINSFWSERIHGKAYRCRLNGIGTTNHKDCKSRNSETIKQNRNVFIDVKRFIDRADGWVNCTLTDIDIHGRLLIEMNIEINSEVINLKDFILKQVNQEKNPTFYPYLKVNSLSVNV